MLQCCVGVSEGRPRNVVQGGQGQQAADHWFSTNESAHPAPWVELHLPHNVRLLSLQHYTFTHGHHRSSYFRYCCSLSCPHALQKTLLWVCSCTTAADIALCLVFTVNGNHYSPGNK